MRYRKKELVADKTGEKLARFRNPKKRNLTRSRGTRFYVWREFSFSLLYVIRHGAE